MWAVTTRTHSKGVVFYTAHHPSCRDARKAQTVCYQLVLGGNEIICSHCHGKPRRPSVARAHRRKQDTVGTILANGDVQCPKCKGTNTEHERNNVYVCWSCDWYGRVVKEMA